MSDVATPPLWAMLAQHRTGMGENGDDMTAQLSRPRIHSRAEFMRRVVSFTLFGLAFLAVSLGIGVLGYHHLAGLSWIDSWFNAAMILTGMGPANEMPSDSAKVFASCYAIFSGAVYPAVTAIILYPLVHRMMVVLHVQDGSGPGDNP